jgi:hypothetical protein
MFMKLQKRRAPVRCLLQVPVRQIYPWRRVNPEGTVASPFTCENAHLVNPSIFICDAVPGLRELVFKCGNCVIQGGDGNHDSRM